jgi:hypothetical protein
VSAGFALALNFAFWRPSEGGFFSKGSLVDWNELWWRTKIVGGAVAYFVVIGAIIWFVWAKSRG